MEERKVRERKEPGKRPKDERVKGTKVEGWCGYSTSYEVSAGGAGGRYVVFLLCQSVINLHYFVDDFIFKTPQSNLESNL